MRIDKTYHLPVHLLGFSHIKLARKKMSRVEVTSMETHLKLLFPVEELFTLFITCSHIYNIEFLKTRKRIIILWELGLTFDQYA